MGEISSSSGNDESAVALTAGSETSSSSHSETSSGHGKDSITETTGETAHFSGSNTETGPLSAEYGPYGSGAEISFPSAENDGSVGYNSGETARAANKEVSATQESANEAYEQTKADMIAEHGKAMSEEQLSRLQAADSTERVHVMSASDYVEAFPKNDLNVLGHCDAEGNIYMKDSTKERVNHVSTHEAMHYCANREFIYNENTGETVRISGLRESTLSNDNKVISVNNRGVNEGLTEMYTLRELRARGDREAADAITSYREAREWSERMENLVGKEYYESAYFGKNRDALEKEFNRLNDNPNAWKEYSKDIDTLTYSENANEISEANQRIMDKFITMTKTKMKG